MPVPTVLFFLKAPVPGYVKTRLARDLGEEEACAVYCALAERQYAAFPPGWPVHIHFAPSAAELRMRAWLEGADRYVPQSEGDLGYRLNAASAETFLYGPEPVFFVGADCPGLVAEDFWTALHFLAHGHDAVFGPARDGGYYLLALKRHAPEVFRGISWGGPDVLRQSLERAGKAGLRTALLEEKEDIDGLDALKRSFPQFAGS